MAVCALTYLRPEGLRNLLDGLDRLVVPAGVELAVVIVDNDPAGSAAATLAARTPPAGSIEPVYVGEPRRGISHARNTAVRTGLALGADAICFIDDDEWPDPDWLAELIASADATGADVVTGPVIPAFETTPPDWVTDGRFFERPRYAHNATIGYATTSSVLLRSSLFADRPEPFDLAFGLSGGEDTHLFNELRDAGHTMVFSDRAIVFETIPSSRVNARWLLRREYRRGQTLSLSIRRRDNRPVRILRRGANGVGQVVQGAARTIVGLPRGRARWLNGIKQVMFGAGMLTGLFGRRYQEYEQIHGS